MATPKMIVTITCRPGMWTLMNALTCSGCFADRLAWESKVIAEKEVIELHIANPTDNDRKAFRFYDIEERT